MTTIKGTILKFRYKAEASAFKIAEFQPEKKSDGEIAILKGLIDVSNLGMSVTISGDWIDDPKYGRQFVVKECVRNQPTDQKSTQEWLLKQKKGIGPKLAKDIGKYFKDNLRNIIENDWNKLTLVKRVSGKIADAIHKAWVDDALIREVQLLLIKGGISSTEAVARKVIRRFKENSIARILDNPYRLTEISGIGFKTADAMSRQLGWSVQRPERIEAAAAYLLLEAAEEGHSFLHRGELTEAIQKLAIIEVDGIEELLPESDALEAIERAVKKKDIIQEKINIAGQDNFLCYLPLYYDLEVTAAKRIADLLSLPHVPPNNIDKILKKVESKLDLELSEQQRSAIIQALTNNCSVITGLPGTGKTASTKALIQTSIALGLTTMVAAPTGRAAKRLQELTGFEAKTIHRMLQYNPKLDEFNYNESNPLPCDMLIIDEASMLNLELMVSVLNAIPDSCSVVWIGDINQLPSIGVGMVLRDLISSNRVYTTTLDKIFRQAEGSLIIQNAHRIFKGEMPKFPGISSDEDSYWIKVPKGKSQVSDKEVDDIEFVKSKLPSIYKRLKDKFGFDPIKDIQVMMPMRVGNAGSVIFNEVIQGIVNPDGERFEISGKVFKLNDRIMQTVNDYELDVYNGDVGFIESIDIENKTLDIKFFDRDVTYPFESISNLMLAYACSVHKLQGCESPVTIIVLLSHHYVMLDRNLIYTANTRARKLAIYLSSYNAVDTAVHTQKVLKRNSLLSQRIRSQVKAKEVL